MSEKENMGAGRLYFAGGPQLTAERLAAKDLCHAFNLLPPSHTEEQGAILQKLLGRMGPECSIMAPFWCDYGWNITVGRHFFANHNCVILDCAAVTFGDFVFIGPGCGFYTAAHPIDAEATVITVGSHVWFGGGVQVMPGVTIGSSVVIGSGSVVTRDLPDGVVAAGNPCRVLRPITPEDRKTVFES